MRCTHVGRAGFLRLWVVVAILLVGAVAPQVQAQREARRPRLVLLIVVDQLRADYVTRFSGYFGDGGFRRMMANGAYFGSAYYSYSSATTAAGHTTVVTGRLPREHGIVGDDWVQGAPGNLSLRSAFFDPDAKILVGPGGRTEGRSPKNLIGTALGDQLRLANRFSRVFSVSLKDQAAIAMGGKRPDTAFWWDLNNGQYVTSNYYMENLPAYVREFNTGHWADRYMGNRWDRVLPQSAYAFTYPLDPVWLLNTEGLGTEFPHLVPRPPAQPGREYYSAVAASPFGNEVVLEMARRILAGERLGASDNIDMLCVGLSSFGTAGQLYGPESAEMLDFIIRTDRQIAAFLDTVDRAVGLNRCVVVLTGSYGIETAPRVASTLGLGGGRIDMTGALKSVNEKLNAIAALPGNADYITTTAMPWAFMNPAADALDGQTRDRVMAAAREELQRVEGIADVFTDQELAGPSPLPDNLQRYLAWRCYCPGRSGSLYVHLAPYWNLREDGFAEQSTSYNHSRHVPIFIMGGGARPGRYFTAADPMDIPITLAALLGIEPPLGAEGRVLNEAFDPGEWLR